MSRRSWTTLKNNDFARSAKAAKAPAETTKSWVTEEVAARLDSAAERDRATVEAARRPALDLGDEEPRR